MRAGTTKESRENCLKRAFVIVKQPLLLTFRTYIGYWLKKASLEKTTLFNLEVQNFNLHMGLFQKCGLGQELLCKLTAPNAVDFRPASKRCQTRTAARLYTRSTFHAQPLVSHHVALLFLERLSKFHFPNSDCLSFISSNTTGQKFLEKDSLVWARKLLFQFPSSFEKPQKLKSWFWDVFGLKHEEERERKPL